MSQAPVICPKASLPRDLDVTVTISRPQTEIATDMTLMCFLTPDAPFPPDNGRVRYYSTFDSLQADFPLGTAGYFAGQAFFSRSVRPLTLAVGRVFDDPVPAGLLSTDVRLSALRSIANGAFDIQVNGALVSVSGLKFTSVTSLAGVAAALNSALGSSGLSAAARYGGLTLETAVAGPGATLDYAAAPASGTDVSALLGLTRESGAQLWQGYTPEGLAAEATLARTASHCNQRPVSTAGPLTPARACSHLALLPSACVASEPSESHVCLYTLLPDEPAAPWQRTKLFIV